MNDLYVQYMQTKQMVNAMQDKHRIEQIRLEKYFDRTKDESVLPQIDALVKDREETIEKYRTDLNRIIRNIVTNEEMKRRFLTTPLKQALYAHDLK